jgi:hypothetical protein
MTGLACPPGKAVTPHIAQNTSSRRSAIDEAWSERIA